MVHPCLCLTVSCGVCVQEVTSKGRIVEDVVQALRNEEAAKLAAQRDAQAARQRVHQLEVLPPLCCPALLWLVAVSHTYHFDGWTKACSELPLLPCILHFCSMLGQSHADRALST